MRTLISGLVIGLVALGTGRGVFAAKCGFGLNDEFAVIAARGDVFASCNCATAATHGAYVSCAAGVVKNRVTFQMLPKSCAGVVKRCAAKSTCGKPGFVTCCLAGKCKLEKDAPTCTAKGGTATVDPQIEQGSCCSRIHPLTENACMASPSGAFLN